MTDQEQSRAIEAIKQAKARYFRSVDTGDSELGRSILADDCVLDYRGCCTDPVTGHDFFPEMNVVMHGSDNWTSDGFRKAGIVSVHQGYNFDISFTGDTSATSICAMTDRLHMPPGSPFALMTGHGYYHETYEKQDDAWKIKTLKIVRLRVESTPPLIDDRLLIRDLIDEYSNVCTQKAWDRLPQLFVQECVWRTEGTHARAFRGHAEIVEAIKAVVEGYPLVFQMPHAPRIQLDGDRATATTLMHEFGRLDADKGSIAYGTYSDRLVRTAAGWKFEERLFQAVHREDYVIGGGL